MALPDTVADVIAIAASFVSFSMVHSTLLLYLLI